MAAPITDHGNVYMFERGRPSRSIYEVYTIIFIRGSSHGHIPNLVNIPEEIPPIYADNQSLHKENTLSGRSAVYMSVK